MKQQYGTEPMSKIAENLATEFHISREEQDAFTWRYSGAVSSFFTLSMALNRAGGKGLS